jgi:hypothetical protein
MGHYLRYKFRCVSVRLERVEDMVVQNRAIGSVCTDMFFVMAGEDFLVNP